MNGKYAFWTVYSVLFLAGISIAISLNAQPVSAECIAPSQAAQFGWQWCVAELEPPPTCANGGYWICWGECADTCDRYKSQPSCSQWTVAEYQECLDQCTASHHAVCP